MHVNVLLFSLLAGLLGSAQAVDIRICKEANLRGDCYKKSNLGKGVCWNFPAAYNDAVSSVRLTGTCTFFGHGGCRVGGGGIEWRVNKGQYNELPDDYNDELSSVRC